jgi:hypothetical protein
MGVDLLRTFVSYRIQLLRWREMRMWRYPGPGCPDHSFQAKLGDAEVDTHVRGICALGVDRRTGPNSVSLREGVVSPWVSPLELAFV